MLALPVFLLSRILPEVWGVTLMGWVSDSIFLFGLRCRCLRTVLAMLLKLLVLRWLWLLYNPCKIDLANSNYNTKVR